MGKKYRKSRSRSRENQPSTRVGEPRIQVELPPTELLTAARESVIAMAMEAGLLSMRAIIEDEVERLVGKRYEHRQERKVPHASRPGFPSTPVPDWIWRERSRGVQVL